MMNKVQIKIAGFSTSLDPGSTTIIFCSGENPERLLCMAMGKHEAQLVAIAHEKIISSSPFVHELFHDLLQSLNGTIIEIAIDELKDSIFHSTIHYSNGTDSFFIKARPADSIAIGIKSHAPIYMLKDIFDQHSFQDTVVVKPSILSPDFKVKWNKLITKMMFQ